MLSYRMVNNQQPISLQQDSRLGFVQNQINEKVGTDVAVDIDEITRLIDLDFVGDLVMVDTKDAKVRIWID